MDRRTDLVFNEDELKSLLPCPLIKHLAATPDDSWTDTADLLALGPLVEGSDKSAIALIPLGKMPNGQLQAFSAELSRALNGRELLVSTDLRETSRCSRQLLITSPGIATRSEISQLCQKLDLQGVPLAGWISLEPNLELE